MTNPRTMTRDEQNARNREKRAANRDEANAKRRAYYRVNKEKITEINRRWDKAHPEQKKAARRKWTKGEKSQTYMREWGRENPGRRLEYGRKSYHKNKERTKPIRAIRAASRRAAEVGTFTYADVQAKLVEQLHSCNGCARSFSTALSPTVDHIVPLSRGGSNWPDNIQLMCMSCNDSKGARTMGEWYDWLEAA